MVEGNSMKGGLAVGISEEERWQPPLKLLVDVYGEAATEQQQRGAAEGQRGAAAAGFKQNAAEGFPYYCKATMYCCYPTAGLMAAAGLLGTLLQHRTLQCKTTTTTSCCSLLSLPLVPSPGHVVT